jgi:3-dehydroquinate dehydratase-2
MIGWLHGAADAGSAVVINAGAWTHTSVAVRDAASQVAGPLVEVHLSNVHAREEFRRHSYVSPVATAVIAGLGVDGYLAAIRWLAGRG